MKFAFIAKHQGIWPLSWLCSALGVSRSGVHAWLTRKPSQRAIDDERIGAEPMAPAGSGTTSWRTASIAACTGSSG